MRAYRELLSGISAIALLALATGSASAASSVYWTNFYVSVFVGGASGNGTIESVVSQSYDPEWSATTYLLSNLGNGLYGGIALGTEVMPDLRGEVELSQARLGTDTTWTQDLYDPEFFTQSGFSDGTLDATFLLANFWYDVPTGGSITPYFGGGVGFAHLNGTFTADPTLDPEAGMYRLDVDSFGLAAQIGVGARVQVAPNIMINFGYRYKVTAGPTASLTSANTTDPMVETSTHNGSHSTGLIGVSVFQVGLDVSF